MTERYKRRCGEAPEHWLAGGLSILSAFFRNEAKLEMRINLSMSMLGKSQGGLDQRKRTQIGLKMASFPARMGLFWAFSKLGANTPTPYTARGPAARSEHYSRAGRGYTAETVPALGTRQMAGVRLQFGRRRDGEYIRLRTKS